MNIRLFPLFLAALAALLPARAIELPEGFNSYTPAVVCHRHGLWKDVDASRDSRMKRLAAECPAFLTSGHAGSSLSFGFEGDMFGLYDIDGPETGQLEVYIDGMMARFKALPEGSEGAPAGAAVYEATPLTGTHYLNRFSGANPKGYASSAVFVKVEPGAHQVTMKLSDTKPDKRKLMGPVAAADTTLNTEKLDKTYLMLGRLLVRGEIAEAHPVKGLPKMGQQLKWEKKINDYAERDDEQAAWQDATLVAGSSSIDLWKTLETDFPGHRVIRRGVSGTKAIDLYNYRHQLIEPFDPKRIIIYEGDNEIGFKWEIDEMMAWMKKLFLEVRAMKPDAEIYLVSIKPSPRRADSLPKIREVNRLIKEFAESQPRAGYIDIHTPMLDAEGNPRPELFLKDRLHPSAEGYALWQAEFAKVIND